MRSAGYKALRHYPHSLSRVDMNIRLPPFSLRLGETAPLATALLAAAFVFWLYQPGYYSFDSAHQWWMARTGALEDSHPVVMALIWQASRAVLPDPAGFFALQLLMLWSGVALVATALPVRTFWRCVAVLTLGAWPPFLALQPHIWKDVWMVSAFFWAVGALLHDMRNPNHAWRVLAIIALSFAAAFRFNAIFGVLPLLLWLVQRESQLRPALRVNRWARAGFFAGALSAVGFLAMLPAYVVPVKRVHVWPVIALWDLAAVSIQTGQQQIPAPFLGRGAGIAELARDFRPDSNVPSFQSGAIHYWFEADFNNAERARLWKAWWTLPLREPKAWLAHRLRLFAYLLGLHQAEQPDTLVLMYGVVQLNDNPTLQVSAHPWRESLDALWHRCVDTLLFAGWAYALAAIVLLLVAVARRCHAAAAVAASGLTMVLPLFVLAPSSEFRYLLWLVVSVPLAAMLLRWPAHAATMAPNEHP